MTYFKRFFFFGLVNILVMVTLSISASIIGRLLGVDIWAGPYGYLFFISAIFGFGGAIASLLMSKWMAKKAYGLTPLNPNSPNAQERFLVEKVHTLSRKAGITKMPEVALWPSEEVNAFATGPSKNNSLVAVSMGLLNRMNEDEVEGVLAHEVAHIANGDMVTMTLIQGVINTFVLFISRILASIVANAMSGDDERPSFMVELGLSLFFQVVFGLFGSMAVAVFSRWREFRADHMGAQLSSKSKMIGALQKLQGQFDHIARR